MRLSNLSQAQVLLYFGQHKKIPGAAHLMPSLFVDADH